MYHSLNPNLILAYHGCERAVAESLLRNEPFKPSTNIYDWLGHGIYFWEANPGRALSFAREQVARSRIREAYAVGVVLTLGNCIDTLSESSIVALEASYKQLHESSTISHLPLPSNTGGRDRLFKSLDCAVVNNLHAMIEKAGLPPADSVRGLYYEGGELYDKSGFYRKSHTQICMRNVDCIKGVFRLPKAFFAPAGH